MAKNPADEHGSNIGSYPTEEKDGLGRRIGEGSTPLVSGVHGIGDNIVQAVQGDISGGEATVGIMTDIGMLALGGLLAIRDPFYLLADFGLTMVLELIEPLNELIELVSGDPDEMDRLERVWEQVQQATEALSDEAKTAVDEKIPSWTGDAANAARDNLSALQAAIWALAKEANEVREVLQLAKALAEAIYAVIKSILAELVAWLIMRGVIALANSAWSFGASIAEFMLSGAIRAQQAVSKAIGSIQQAAGIFGKIVEKLVKLWNGKAKGLLKAVLTRAGMTAALQAAKVGAEAVLGTGDAPKAPAGVGGGAVGCLTVEVDELDALGAEFDKIAANADKILAVARQAAAATDLTWGAPGLLLKGKYGEACGDFTDSIGKTGPACTGTAQRLTSASKIYSDAESTTSTAMAGITERVGALAVPKLKT